MNVTLPTPLEVACYRATPHGAGAVAMVEIVGDVSACLEALCGKDVEVGALRVRNFQSIDAGLVARLAPERAQLMPHGGPRIVERLAQWLASHGANWIDDPLAARDELDPMELFPEASDRVEALALATLARSASPLAVRLLLAQSDAWKAHNDSPLTDEDHARSARLNRLVEPPRVVLVGSPNAGKSTLSNALLGRVGSIVSAEKGTTRDAVSARIDLAGLVVEWFDLPGLRETSDPIESEAIALAQRLLRDADMVISLAAPGIGWCASDRAPDLRVFNKIDSLDARESSLRHEATLAVSARTGEGLAALREAVREKLVPRVDRDCARPWMFDARLIASR
jgi:tRNA modification GTPase